jgi:hypothetical protein
VPPYVANAIVLESLDLSYNAFSGVLPSLEKLTHLKVLILSNNQFEGDFPGAICDGPALRTIDMSNNAMKGMLFLPLPLYVCIPRYLQIFGKLLFFGHKDQMHVFLCLLWCFYRLYYRIRNFGMRPHRLFIYLFIYLSHIDHAHQHAMESGSFIPICI